ncbi:MAG: hypothetical protein DRP64_04790 [Verrucomicrobia bacterium]|nr:MAG: hypothetical protein DRP64_04790 [Verrucomicrobiota bacterium]
MNGMIKSLLGVAIVGSVLASSAQTKFPLRVDIDVSTRRHRKNIGAGDSGEVKVEQVQVRVKIRKSGGQPYEEKLTAELYVIGKQIHTDYYGIVDVVKKDFNFTKENDNTVEFLTRTYALPQTSGNIDVGGEYETYLLVVVDKEGKIIDTRSGRNIRDKGIDLIRELGPKTLFDEDGNVVGMVDGTNSAFKRAAPAALRSDD